MAGFILHLMRMPHADRVQRACGLGSAGAASTGSRRLMMIGVVLTEVPAAFRISIRTRSLTCLLVRTIRLPSGVSLSLTFAVSPGGMLKTLAANRISVGSSVDALTNRLIWLVHRVPDAGSTLHVMGMAHPDSVQWTSDCGSAGPAYCG